MTMFQCIGQVINLLRNQHHRLTRFTTNELKDEKRWKFFSTHKNIQFTKTQLSHHENSHNLILYRVASQSQENGRLLNEFVATQTPVTNNKTWTKPYRDFRNEIFFHEETVSRSNRTKERLFRIRQSFIHTPLTESWQTQLTMSVRDPIVAWLENDSFCRTIYFNEKNDIAE